MNDEQQMTGQESLRLITDMIQKAKASTFLESGSGAIMWGSVVGFCGLFSFAQNYWHFSTKIDVWDLTLLALLPQIFISIKEKKNRVVKTDKQMAINAVWIVYGISIFAVIAYINIVPITSVKLLANDGIQLLQKDAAGNIKPFIPFILSYSSIFIIIYAFPTLVTGIANGFKPMIYGAFACYIFFFISLYTSSVYDQLLCGLAGIGNWLIPGLILRNRFIKGKTC